MKPHSLALASCVALSACARPKPPTLTPRSSEIARSDARGLGLRVNFDARNDNPVALTVRSLDVKVYIAGQEQGRAQISQVTRLPARGTTPLSVVVSVPWSNLPGLLFSTALTENVPYRVEGTARVGGESVNFDVPFRVNSTMPRSVLMSAAQNPLGGGH